MIEDEGCPAPRPVTPANDNGDAGARFDAAALTLARLLGRQMAREEFARRRAATDNDAPQDRATETPPRPVSPSRLRGVTLGDHLAPQDRMLIPE